MVWTVVLFAVGLALIIKGGDWFLDGAVWLAEATGIPRFVIGATVVSLSTTLPELTVSAMGVLQGETDMAVGNAVGSVTANLGLILGVSALFLPGKTDRRQLALRAMLMLLAAALLLVLCGSGTLRSGEGWLLAAVFAAYLALSLADAAGSRGEARRKPPKEELGRKLPRFAAGAAAILAGSQLLIRYGSRLALALGVPAGVVGVTLVAVGTSLPELTTTLTAIAKGESALSVGNIVGANIIDLTLILPVCALLSGGALPVGERTVGLDLPVLLTLGVAAFLPPLLRGRFSRWQGAALLGIYAGYVALLVA